MYRDRRRTAALVLLNRIRHARSLLRPELGGAAEHSSQQAVVACAHDRIQHHPVRASRARLVHRSGGCLNTRGGERSGVVAGVGVGGGRGVPAQPLPLVVQRRRRPPSEARSQLRAGNNGHAGEDVGVVCYTAAAQLAHEGVESGGVDHGLRPQHVRTRRHLGGSALGVVEWTGEGAWGGARGEHHPQRRLQACAVQRHPLVSQLGGYREERKRVLRQQRLGRTPSSTPTAPDRDFSALVRTLGGLAWRRC
mmetsp:Transcript_13740/g.23610  ORF Transcript_13740/g.23610 Transcript_13740/m.23610 type:complete len:251 (-) Transcript_13740:485-1237(-)